jgi:hypothetical protein
MGLQLFVVQKYVLLDVGYGRKACALHVKGILCCLQHEPCNAISFHNAFGVQDWSVDKI